MKRKNTTPSFKLAAILLYFSLLIVMFSIDRFQEAAANNQIVEELIWFDDFESYPVPVYPEINFPDPPWRHSGHMDAFVYHDQSVSGNQSLKLTGVFGEDECGGAVAYRYIGGSAPLEIEAWVRNSDEPLAGCHQKYGGIELSTGPDWTTDHRGLIAFTYSGEIRGGAFEVDEGDGIFLQNYVPHQWYKVKIRYERIGNQVALTYWVDDVQRGSHQLPALAHEGSLSFVGLWSGEGVAWFDDVSLTAVPFNFTHHIYLPMIQR